MSLQGFCFFDLCFYTLESQLRYPSLIPFLTLHHQTGLTLHLSGLGWLPAQVREEQGQSCNATHQPGPEEVLHIKPPQSPTACCWPHELSILQTSDILTHCLLCILFVLRKSCPDQAKCPNGWHGSGWHGIEICKQYWKLPFKIVIIIISAISKLFGNKLEFLRARHLLLVIVLPLPHL